MPIEIAPQPPGFESYWLGVMEELAALPPAPELTLSPLRTTEFATLYELRLTSSGPYRIFAFYSIPHGNGPFPVVYHAPRYGSVVHIAPYEERQRYVTVALRHRGQRLADQPFAAAYPGLLTTGIESRESYIYRGIVADCCRVIDFLTERPEVDAGRIAVVGDDLALMTAALRSQVDALYCTPALFYAARQLAVRTSAYPLEELNDYARAYPERAEAMWQTLAYFDPIHFAPNVRAGTVLVTGNERDLFSPQVTAPLANAFTAPVTTYESQHSSYRDGVHEMSWIAQRYGFGELILPPHWSV
jgi:cephalosporin-C deacetylase-like acetyl esterase